MPSAVLDILIHPMGFISEIQNETNCLWRRQSWHWLYPHKCVKVSILGYSYYLHSIFDSNRECTVKYEQQQWLHRVWSKQESARRKDFSQGHWLRDEVGSFFWHRFWSRFRIRSHQFSALHVLSIRKDNCTEIARASCGECCVFCVLGKRTADRFWKDTIIYICAPEIFDRVLVELSSTAYVQYLTIVEIRSDRPDFAWLPGLCLCFRKAYIR